MFEKLVNGFTHMAMLWNVLIPLGIIALFCVVLYWEGKYGHVGRIIRKIRGIKPAEKLPVK